MNITLRQLRYFLSLAQHTHFTRAAESINVTQPALSMQIRALEEEIGARLVERTPQGVVLTPQGRALQDHAQRVMAAMTDLEQDLRQPGQGGRLMLGMIPTVAPYLLPEALPLLRARDIGRDLHLREAQTDRLLDELQAGRLDAIVVATARPKGRACRLYCCVPTAFCWPAARRESPICAADRCPLTRWILANFCCWTRGIALATRPWRSAG